MSLFVHRAPFNVFVKRCPVSFVLIVLMTLAFLIDLVFPMDPILHYGALQPFRVYYGQWYRLFLTIFIHGGFIHFLFNTFFGLAILGAGLEKLIGSIKYAVVFLFSGIGSSLLIYFVNLRINPFLVTIGASGAIFGFLGVFLYIILFRRELIWESDRQYLVGLLVLNLITTFIAPNISILGHIGGLICGFIIAYFLFLSGFKGRREHRRLRKEWKKIQRKNRW